MRSKRNAGEWSGTPSAFDSSSSVTVGSIAWVPLDDHDAVAVARGARRRSPSRSFGSRPGTSDAGRWSVSIAIVSPSASRSRLITRISSDGETWRSRPSRAPASSRVEREGPAAGDHAAAAHVLAERGHRQLLRDLRLLDVGAAAAPADEVALAGEVVERGADGQARDAEIGAELPLGGDRGADAEPLDQVEHLLARRALLRHSLGSGRRHGAGDYSRSSEKWSMPLRSVGPIRYRSTSWLRSCSTTSRRSSPATSSPSTTSRSRSRAGEFLVLVGPSGLRQVDAAADDRRARGGDRAARSSIDDRDVTELPPRARDIAMVFQSYALYPHMTVRENLGYGLEGAARRQARDRASASTRSRSCSASRSSSTAGPRALSGGQRQRVAMGRAIVREPKAFLMDEPLSNLDAKLRVSMRAQLAALHARLGDDDDLRHPRPGRGDDARPARRRDARRARPADGHAAGALRGAGQPLRRRVHRLARDEPRRGRRRGRRASRSAAIGSRVPARRRRPATIVGIRPESFEDAAFADPSLPQIDVEVQVVEDLGADAHVIFQVDAPPVDVSEVREAAGDEEALAPSRPCRLHRARRPADDGRVGRAAAARRSTRRASTSSTRRRVCGSSSGAPGWLAPLARRLRAAAAPGETIVSALAGPPKPSFLAKVRARRARRRDPRRAVDAARDGGDDAAAACGRCAIGRPLLLLVDQEGGYARRLTWAAPAQTARELGRLGIARTRAEARATAAALRAAGIDVDLAPVADTLRPGGFLGSRSFGSDASRGRRLARGVHPRTAGRRHRRDREALPRSRRRAAEHRRLRRLAPPARARPVPPRDRRRREARDGLERVVSALDNTGTPAVFSRPIVTGLLRGTLGFNGVVVTDALDAPTPARTPHAAGARDSRPASTCCSTRAARPRTPATSQLAGDAKAELGRAGERRARRSRTSARSKRWLGRGC